MAKSEYIECTYCGTTNDKSSEKCKHCNKYHTEDAEEFEEYINKSSGNKTIIRIEHPNSGDGIWQHMESNEHLCDYFSFYDRFASKHKEFPSPRKDLGINRPINHYEYCAFKSIEQIHQWIEKEWFSEIISSGFKIYMIDVSECIEGEYQILFRKEHILQQKDISSLFI